MSLTMLMVCVRIVIIKKVERRNHLNVLILIEYYMPKAYVKIVIYQYIINKEEFIRKKWNPYEIDIQLGLK